jgi:hypothetical protein
MSCGGGGDARGAEFCGKAFATASAERHLPGNVFSVCEDIAVPERIQAKDEFAGVDAECGEAGRGVAEGEEED